MCKILSFRSCNTFNCLGVDKCQSAFQLNFVYITPMQMSPTSHCPGNIEAACNLMKTQMELPCAGTNQNTMLVSIVNGEVHLSVPFR